MSNTTTTCAGLARLFGEAYPAPMSFLLTFGGCAINVATNSVDLLTVLMDYFSEFVFPGEHPDITISVLEAPAPELGLDFNPHLRKSGKRIRQEYIDLPDGRVVRKRRTGMTFVFGGGLHMAVGPCLDNPHQVINFVNNRFIDHKLNQGCLPCKAAGVAHSGRGLALAGAKGMGKSALALRLMSKGTTFVSNDRIMAENGPQGPHMYGVAKQPRVKPGTALHNPDLTDVVTRRERDKLLVMPEEQLWEVRDKYVALIDRCFGPGRFVLESPLSALVVLNWARGGGELRVAEVDPMERTDLLRSFIKKTGLFHLPDKSGKPLAPSLEKYAAFLSSTKVIELSGGVHFSTATARLLDFLKTGTLDQ